MFCCLLFSKIYWYAKRIYILCVTTTRQLTKTDSLIVKWLSLLTLNQASGVRIAVREIFTSFSLSIGRLLTEQFPFEVGWLCQIFVEFFFDRYFWWAGIFWMLHKTIISRHDIFIGVRVNYLNKANKYLEGWGYYLSIISTLVNTWNTWGKRRVPLLLVF